MRAPIRANTPDEEEAIGRGIASDPDSPELDESFFASARPAADVLPPETMRKGVRGPAKRPAKAQVTLRIDRDVLQALRSSGPGWQSRANAALRKLVS